MVRSLCIPAFSPSALADARVAVWGSQSSRAALDLAAPKPPWVAPRPAWVDILNLPTPRDLLHPQAANTACGPIPTHEGELKNLPGQSVPQRPGALLVNDHTAYVLGPVLGAGAYGVVRLAAEVGAAGGRFVAVKDWDLNSLRDEIAGPAQRLDFALNEYEMMRTAGSALRPASLTITRNASEQPEHLYAVLPPLLGDGVDFTRRVRHHKPAATALWARYVLCSLADDLVTLRAQGVLHADIKPDNLFMDMTYRLHLGDFGLAAPLQGPQAARGTLEYVAWEQLGGLFDDRADVWASAVTTLAVLGDNPFAQPKHIERERDLNVDDAYHLRRVFRQWRNAELADNPVWTTGERSTMSHVNNAMRVCQRAEPTLCKLLVNLLEHERRDRVDANALLPAVEPMRLSPQETRTLQKTLLQLPPTPAARLITRALLDGI